MIIDSSAVVAVVFGEDQADAMVARFLAAPFRRISAANLLETYMVVDRSPERDAGSDLNQFFALTQPTVEPVTHAQVLLARSAFRRFGKGSGHAARLNFGDCFAYSLAQLYDEPLLFIGNDFSATDVQPAL